LIDIRMDKLQGSSRISGRVVDGKTGQPARTANVMLVPRDMEAAGATPKAGIYNAAAGTFEIRNVEPGSYMLMAMGGNMLGFLAAMIGEDGDLPATPPPANAPAPETAQMSLEVRGDMDDLVLKMSSGVPISGMATVSGLGSIAALPGLAQIRLMLASGEDNPMDGGFNLPTRIAADGKFNVRPTPGTYKIAVMELPPNVYVKAARLGTADILDGTVTVDDGTIGTIQLEFGTNTGEIEGSILDKEMKPVKAMQAVLIPEKRSRRDLYKTVTTGDDGRFSLIGITPGTYKLFAWEDLEANAYYDGEVLRQYEAQGKAVVVTESGKAQVELKPIQN
jgi:5-hydroxyisourate hydrolase-like protein (transthyretin family)